VEVMKEPALGLRLTVFFNFKPPHLNQRAVIRGQRNGQAHERRQELFKRRHYLKKTIGRAGAPRASELESKLKENLERKLNASRFS
jgi:hypothetical protein